MLGRHLAALHEDDDHRQAGAEDAAEHGGRRAHGVHARLDVPARRQPLHQQQAARRAKGAPDLIIRGDAASLSASLTHE